MYENSRPNGIIRDMPPCYKCQERFTACSDNCPIDARGGFGYKAWRKKVEEVKKAKKEHYQFDSAQKHKHY